MENCGFQSQVLSVMEVLAKAAVAEIKRRVDDSCAVLRLEVSQSRRDIDLLQRKCEAMEAELRRTRMRAKRKVFYPPAAEGLSPLVKIVLNKERHSRDSNWNRQVDAEVQNQPQQLADTDPANEAEHMRIKEESSEDDDTWKKNEPEDKLISEAEEPPRFKALQSIQTDNFVDHYHQAENPADAAPVVSPGYDTFLERQLNGNQNETEIVVKHEKEEEPDENAAPLDPGHRFMSQEGDGQLWSSRETGDSSFPYAGDQFEQIPTVFTSQSSLHLQDLVPRIHSVGKSLVVSAARIKRRVRTFGCRRPQPDEGHGALSQINSIDQSSIPQQTQHQCRDSAPHARSPHEDLTVSNPAAPAFRGHGRASTFSLVRRMRTPWTSGIGEKRFSCTYCDKSFMRFSQLKEHLRSHTGEKPFSCLQCGRSFTKQCNLIRHAVVHSGEKPYECSLCGKCFTQRSSLKSHQKTAH